MAAAVAKLPARARGDARQRRPSSTRVAEDTANILLVDDDARVRRLVARVLRGRGFVVTEAEDGQQALELAAASPPDIALVDLRLPRVHGFEVVRQLKGERPQAPVLVLSGLDDPEERLQAFDAGADDFIAKPIYIQELIKRIDACERTRRAYLELEQANERTDHLRLFANEAAALLAHDLNNGLSIASANLQFLDEELQSSTDDEEVLDALAASRRALRRMIGLVGNFVDITRLEDAALSATRLPTEVRGLLTLASQLHESRRGPDDLEIEIDCAPELTADIDPMLIERVLHNLLNNATRYVSPGGRIRLTGRLEESEDGTPELYLGVGNTGSAIPPALRDSLFAKYRKGSDGKAQRGMGLYFCRLACEAHGGSIVVEEDPTFHTLFSIRIPLGV